MMKKSRVLLALCAFIALVTIVSSANALDAYRDRRGVFGGIGLGGGGAFQGGDPGGGILGNLELGGGASNNLTLAMDVDLWFHIMNSTSTFIMTPGPKIRYFFGESGLFVQGGIGMALTWVEDADFIIGFDGSAGAGWEFFGGADTTLGFGVESDYIVLKGEDIVTMSFLLNLRFY